MGYLLKVTRENRPSEFIALFGSVCSLYMDTRGIICREDEAAFGNIKILIIKTAENYTQHTVDFNLSSGEKRQARFDHSFSCRLQDFNLDIIAVSETALMLSKLNKKELYKAQSAFSLECPGLGLKVALYSGTTVTVGSHSSDTITVNSGGIRPQHAAISLQSGNRPQIKAKLGAIDIRDDSQQIIFRLLPAEEEFVIKASGHQSKLSSDGTR